MILTIETIIFYKIDVNEIIIMGKVTI